MQTFAGLLCERLLGSFASISWRQFPNFLIILKKVSDAKNQRILINVDMKYLDCLEQRHYFFIRFVLCHCHFHD